MKKRRKVNIIDEYWKEVGDSYPELSVEQFREICYTPFKMLKDIWKRGSLEEVRFKYFGTFVVVPSRAKREYKYLPIALSKGNLDREQYLIYKENIENYFKLNNIDYEDIGNPGDD